MKPEEIEKLGFYGFVDVARQWLERYPSGVFTGSSGDAGPLFVVAIREAVEQLETAQETKPFDTAR